MSLERISIITAILGIAILLFLSQKLEPKLMGISEIDENILEQYVKVEGNIISSKDYENFVLLTLQDETGKINIIVYKPKENLTDRIEVVGKVKEYKGKLEIEASKVNIK